ncbi:MAG: TraX family protein [Saccharofermentanales bacterium]
MGDQIMLKWLALLFMTIDHIGYYFSAFLPIEVYYLFRSIGRLAFPIFAFYLVIGFTRTRNPFHYLFRMACWSVIAHFAISAANLYTGRQMSIWSLEWTNILVLFTFGIFMLLGYDLAMRSYRDMIVSLTPVSYPPYKMAQTNFDLKVNIGGISLSPRIGVPVGIAMIILSFIGVFALHSDYEFYGLLTILFIYISYQKEDDRISLPILLFLLITLNVGYVVFAGLTQQNIQFSLIQCLSLLSVFLMTSLGRSSKKPGYIEKYFFYVYYPAHIVLMIFLSGALGKV